jgi:hypothetical protein
VHLGGCDMHRRRGRGGFASIPADQAPDHKHDE